MTRNLYLGADLIPLAAAPAAQFQHAAAGVFDSVVATDPNARMKLVAAEIAKVKPDLVGLQEVSLWRAGTVRYDYTGALMKALGHRYRVVAFQRRFNVEGRAAPGLRGRPPGGGPDPAGARGGSRPRPP